MSPFKVSKAEPKLEPEEHELEPTFTHDEGVVRVALPSDLESQTSQTSDKDNTIVHDAVFGEIREGGPNYRSMGMLVTAVLMAKTQIGLGVLNMPSVFDKLGLIPGVICVLAVATITTWAGYYIGKFKLLHPAVYAIDDAGQIIAGRFGRETLAIAYNLYWVFVAGSGQLGMSIALNALSGHGTCTAVFVVIAAIAGFLCSSIKTLDDIKWLAWAGLTGIMVAIITLTIGVGVQNRPAAAPQTGIWVPDYKLFASPTPDEAFSALASIVFAFAGTPAFFALISEMKDPREYPKSLALCQTLVTTTYLAIGIVVYYYCGSYVTSPALGSAGPLLKKVCYGFALPGLLVTTTLVTHIPAKYIFVRSLKGTDHLTSATKTHWCVWLGSTLGVSIIAYIIASAIPVFGTLLSLIGALFGTLMCFIPQAGMWLYDNWQNKRTLPWKLMVAWCVFVIVSGAFLMIAGTYGSVVEIITTYQTTGGSAAWSCADNSGSS